MVFVNRSYDRGRGPRGRDSDSGPFVPSDLIALGQRDGRRPSGDQKRERDLTPAGSSSPERDIVKSYIKPNKNTDRYVDKPKDAYRRPPPPRSFKSRPDLSASIYRVRMGAKPREEPFFIKKVKKVFGSLGFVFVDPNLQAEPASVRIDPQLINKPAHERRIAHTPSKTSNPLQKSYEMIRKGKLMDKTKRIAHRFSHNSHHRAQKSNEESKDRRSESPQSSGPSKSSPSKSLLSRKRNKNLSGSSSDEDRESDNYPGSDSSKRSKLVSSVEISKHERKEKKKHSSSDRTDFVKKVQLSSSVDAAKPMTKKSDLNSEKRDLVFPPDHTNIASSSQRVPEIKKHNSPVLSPSKSFCGGKSKGHSPRSDDTRPAKISRSQSEQLFAPCNLSQVTEPHRYSADQAPKLPTITEIPSVVDERNANVACKEIPPVTQRLPANVSHQSPGVLVANSDVNVSHDTDDELSEREATIPAALAKLLLAAAPSLNGTEVLQNFQAPAEANIRQKRNLCAYCRLHGIQSFKSTHSCQFEKACQGRQCLIHKRQLAIQNLERRAQTITKNMFLECAENYYRVGLTLDPTATARHAEYERDIFQRKKAIQDLEDAIKKAKDCEKVSSNPRIFPEYNVLLSNGTTADVGLIAQRVHEQAQEEDKDVQYLFTVHLKKAGFSPLQMLIKSEPSCADQNNDTENDMELERELEQEVMQLRNQNADILHSSEVSNVAMEMEEEPAAAPENPVPFELSSVQTESFTNDWALIEDAASEVVPQAIQPIKRETELGGAVEEEDLPTRLARETKQNLDDVRAGDLPSQAELSMCLTLPQSDTSSETDSTISVESAHPRDQIKRLMDIFGVDCVVEYAEKEKKKSEGLDSEDVSEVLKDPRRAPGEPVQVELEAERCPVLSLKAEPRDMPSPSREPAPVAPAEPAETEPIPIPLPSVKSEPRDMPSPSREPTPVAPAERTETEPIRTSLPAVKSEPRDPEPTSREQIPLISDTESVRAPLHSIKREPGVPAPAPPSDPKAAGVPKRLDPVLLMAQQQRALAQQLGHFQQYEPPMALMQINVPMGQCQGNVPQPQQQPIHQQHMVAHSQMQMPLGGQGALHQIQQMQNSSAYPYGFLMMQSQQMNQLNGMPIQNNWGQMRPSAGGAAASTSCPSVPSSSAGNGMMPNQNVGWNQLMHQQMPGMVPNVGRGMPIQQPALVDYERLFAAQNAQQQVPQRGIPPRNEAPPQFPHQGVGFFPGGPSAY